MSRALIVGKKEKAGLRSSPPIVTGRPNRSLSAASARVRNIPTGSIATTSSASTTSAATTPAAQNNLCFKTADMVTGRAAWQLVPYP